MQRITESKHNKDHLNPFPLSSIFGAKCNKLRVMEAEPRENSADVFKMEEIKTELTNTENDAESDINLTKFNLDFSSKRKKKRKPKRDDEHGDSAIGPATVKWEGYTYEFLINRIFEKMFQINPTLNEDAKRAFTTKPPMIARLGTKKTAFVNFDEISRSLKRNHSQMLQGSVDANGQLIIKGRFLQKHVESIVRKYVKEYVLCHTCKSHNTDLVKETRLLFLQCNSCGSKCSVTNVKTGYQAQTGKRKTAN